MNGADTMFGGFANDRLDGGNGDNHLIGGPGDDRILRGRGLGPSSRRASNPDRVRREGRMTQQPALPGRQEEGAIAPLLLSRRRRLLRVLLPRRLAMLFLALALGACWSPPDARPRESPVRRALLAGGVGHSRLQLKGQWMAVNRARWWVGVSISSTTAIARS